MLNSKDRLLFLYCGWMPIPCSFFYWLQLSLIPLGLALSLFIHLHAHDFMGLTAPLINAVECESNGRYCSPYFWSTQLNANPMGITTLFSLFSIECESYGLCHKFMTWDQTYFLKVHFYCNMKMHDSHMINIMNICLERNDRKKSGGVRLITGTLGSSIYERHSIIVLSNHYIIMLY